MGARLSGIRFFDPEMFVFATESRQMLEILLEFKHRAQMTVSPGFCFLCHEHDRLPFE